MSDEKNQQTPETQNDSNMLSENQENLMQTTPPKADTSANMSTLPPRSVRKKQLNEDQTLNGVKRNKYADKMNKKKKKKLSKKVRIAIGIVIALLFIALCAFLIIRSKLSNKEDYSNQTAFVSYGMIETSIEGDGTTAAKKREELGKDIKGNVKKIYVEVGDEVKKGDKLMDIDPTETKKELQQAEEEVKTAQAAVTEAQRGVTEAQNAVTAAQKKVKQEAITAPFTGKIVPVTNGDGSSITYTVGQQINEGETIGYMVDDNTMKLSIYFNYAYVNDIKAGQTANISIPSSMSSVTGKVSSVEKVQKITEDGVKLFRVIITMNNPGTLTKGMTATATVSSDSAGEVYPADSGSLAYNREEAVTSQISGKITVMNGTDYYQYNSGATIIKVSSDSAQGEVQAAQNALTAAKNVVSSAQKTVSTKQAEVTKLKKAIADSTLKSTMDGVVVNISAVQGEDTTGGTLCVVADLDEIIVNANIAATDVSAVEPGQTAIMTMYTQDGQITLTGTVESVSMEADKELSSGQGGIPIFPAVIAVDSVDDQILRPDYMVQYQIITESVTDCLMVPSAAIVNTEDGTAVFAKAPEGQVFDYAMPIPEGTEGIPEGFELIPVEIGISNSTHTEIFWGIEEGTEVFLAGPEDLYGDMDIYATDGMAVAVG